MKIFLLTIISFVIGIALLGQFAQPVAAFDLLPVNCSAGNNSQSAVCNGKSQVGSNPIFGSDGIIAKITDLIAIIAGIAAVVILIVGGLKLIASSGDANRISAARTTVMNAIIGLVIIVVGRTIIVYVVSQL